MADQKKFPGPSPKQKPRDVSGVKRWASAKEANPIGDGLSSDSPEDPSASASPSTSASSASPAVGT